MRVVLGGDSFIGRHLYSEMIKSGIEARCTTRRSGKAVWEERYDLLSPHELTGEVLYLVAANTRIFQCESDFDSYRVNVDGPIEAAKRFKGKVVFLSTVGVMTAIHTAYGIQKALAEIGLRTVCDPVIVRLGKTDERNVEKVVDYLIKAGEFEPGIYFCPT